MSIGEVENRMQAHFGGVFFSVGLANDTDIGRFAHTDKGLTA
jgi:hypothetical protein